MKKIYQLLCLLLALLVFSTKSFAQNNLAAGDIAIVSYQSDFDPTNPIAGDNDLAEFEDRFSIAVLRPGGLAAGTVIFFTTRGWNAVSNNWHDVDYPPFTFGLGRRAVVQWTVPAGGIATGTEIFFINKYHDEVPVGSEYYDWAAYSDEAGTTLINNLINVTPIVPAPNSTDGMGFSFSGDHLLVYQTGPTGGPTGGFNGTPIRFITALHANDNGTTSYALWDPTPGPVNAESSLPPGLVNGQTAFLMTPSLPGEWDNGKFSACALSAAGACTALQMAAIIYNTANWTYSNAVFPLGTSSSFCTYNILPANTITLTSAAGTNAQTRCINTAITNITYSTTGATGATFSGLPAGVTGSWAANVVTISGSPTTTVGSPFSYTVTLTGGCGTVTATGTITVTPNNTITLTSAAGTNNQTRCINTPITNITYSTTGATGATFSGLPAGVTGNWAANVVTISGSPTTTVGSPFSYMVTLTGGCGTVTATGTITVTGLNTITLTSGAGTDNQSVLVNTPITNITYSTTNATGATFSGLPAGVTGAWAANVVTISGSPTTNVGSPFSYTVTLTGGCGTVTATGTITVTTCTAVNQTVSASPTSVCAGGASTITVSASQPGVNYTLRLDPSNTVIEGPTASNGPAINFSTGPIVSATTYNVLAETDKYSVNLNGSQSGFAIPQAAPLDVTDNFTIEGWIKPAGNGDFARLFNKDGCYALGISNNQNDLTFTRHTSGDFSRPFTFVNGTWYHIACTYVGGTVELFVNGISIGTVGGVPPIVTNTAGGHIGSDAGGGFNRFNGNIDNVRIWNSVRTQAQIAANQAAFLTSTGNPTLVASWWIIEGAGNAKDYSANAINATALSGTWQTDAPVAPCSIVLTTRPTVNIIPNNTITLTSAAGTNNQTVCINTAITNITYSTTTATGATFSGLPAGVTGNWAANVVTISGSPTTTVGSPFSYTVTLTGGCGPTTMATGTITVNPLPTITCPGNQIVNAPSNACSATVTYSASSTGTPAPTITYTLTGATTGTGSGTGSGSTFNAGITTVKLTANNTCGTVECTFTVEVRDVTPPVITCPADIVVCGSQVVNYPLPTVTDNCGPVSVPLNLSQTTSNSITPSNSVSCNNGAGHTANSYWRVYDLAPFGLTSPYTVNKVVFGVESANSPSGSQPATIRVHTLSGAFTLANLTQVASENIIINNQSQTLITVTLSAPPTVAANARLVLEVHTPEGRPTNTLFYMGSNTSGQSAPNYISAPDCGVINPIPVSDVGYPNMHSVLNVEGVAGGAPITPVQTAGLPSGATFPMGTTVNTFTATDAAGNISTCSFNVIVNPVPSVDAVANQDVCNDDVTAAVNFSGPVAGTVYNWTNNTPSIGLAAIGTGNIAPFTAINLTSVAVTATITVTPSYTANGATCTGTPVTFTITVNPTPTVNAVANQVVCNGAPTAAVTFTGAPAGTVFNWTNNTPSIGLAASGTGNISSFNAINTTNSPVVATITVTPFTTGGVSCPGIPITFTITVNPTPQVDQPANQVICNNAVTAPVIFTTPTSGGTITYDWTNNNTSIGLGANGTGNIPSFTAINATNVPVVATVTVTPTITIAGGGPIAQTFNFTGAVQTFTVPAGVTSIDISAMGAKGANAAAGGTGGLGGTASGTLAVTPGQVLNIYVGGQNGFNGGGAGGVNGPTGGAPAAANAAGGGGASDIRVGGVALANRVIVAGGGGGGGHNGTWVGCQVAGPGGNGGNGGGLTADDGTFGLTQGPCNCQNGSGDKGLGGSQIAGGTAGGYQGHTDCLRATWTIGTAGTSGQGGDGSLTFNNGTGGGGGGGGGFFGGGAGGSGSDTSPGGGGGGGSSWTGGVTAGTTTPGTNNGDGQVVITYLGTVTCTGPSKTFTYTVNPTPAGSALPQTICSGGTTSVTLNATTPAGGTTYAYTAAIQTTPTGGTITGQGSGTANPIAQTLTNTGTTFGVIRYTVTPSYTNGGVACAGAPFTVDVTVNPTPAGSASPQTICSGGTTSVALTATTPPAGTTYTWTAAIQTTPTGGAITGFSNCTAACGTTIAQTLTNTGSTFGVIRYTVTPSYTNAGQTCAGTPFTVDVTVNPVPVGSASPQTICSGAVTSVTLNATTPPAGTTYSYTAAIQTTPAGGTITGHGSGTANPVAQTLTNTGTTFGVIRYTVTPSYTNAGVTCTGAPFTVDVTVNPSPTGSASPQTICSGGTTSIALSASTPPAGTTYSYTAAIQATPTGGTITGHSSGTANPIVQTLTNTGSSPGVIRYTVTPSYTNGGVTCAGTPFTVDVTVNPVPTVNQPANQVICNGDPTAPVYFTGNLSGTVCATAAEGGSITLTAPPGAVFTNIVFASYGTPGGSCGNFTIGACHAANSMAVVSALAIGQNSVTIGANNGVFGDPCGGTVKQLFVEAIYTLTGAVYTWTNNTTSIGLAASGTGSIPGFTATNITNAPVTATITVTPSYTNAGVTCTGTPRTFTITVNPTATVDAVPNQIVCNGAPTATVNFTSPTTGGTIVYNWTNNTTSIGLAASGTGNIASFTAINVTNAPVTATITVTPTYTNGGVSCVGTAITFTIIVNPPPIIDPVPNQVVCNNGVTTAVNFTTPTTGGTAVFNWTNNNTSIGLSAAGTGNIASFTATNPTNAPVTASVTVILSYTSGGLTCISLPLTFTITVNPTPIVNQPASQTVCAGSPTTAVNFTSPTTGGTLTYNWTNSQPSIGLAAAGTGDIASFTAINNTGAPITAVITVTPTFTNGGVSCTGASKTFTITVNPAPIVNPVANQVVCNNSSTTTVIFSSNVPGAVYNWTNNTTSIGLGASGTGDIPGFIATNAGNAPVVATITVTASYTSGGVTCTSTPVTFTITVNPTPVVNPVANQVVCNNTATAAINFTSPTTGGTIVYNWTNSGAFIGLGPSGTGNIPSFTALNPGITPAVATITVIPTFTNAGVSCAGTPIIFTITVNPTPTVNQPANQVVCAGATTAPVNFTGAVAGTVYTWTNNNTTIGLGASGTGNIPAFTAINAGATVQVATITVTATYTNGGVSCTGTPVSFTITVNPIPTVNQPVDQTVCAGVTVAVNFTGAVTGTVYNWTNSNTAIGLAPSGTGNISFVATNPGALAIAGTITVTPTFTNGGVTCTGTARTFTITVNATPRMDPPLPGNQLLCNGSATAPINFTTSQPGVFFQWTNNQPSIGLASAGAGNIPSFIATNTGTAPVTATVTVTPQSTLTPCIGVPFTFTITVNPVPSVNAIANQALCNGATTTAVTIAGPVPGTVYNWVNNNISIGLAASGTATVPAFTAINNTNAPVTATITVTPTYTNAGLSCTGTPVSFTITVNPTATVNQPGNQVVCNGANTTAIVFTGAPAGSTYNWTNNNTSIGLAASGTGNIAGFTAINTGNTPVTATITVTPTATGCGGSPVSFTITVNPTPTVNVIANQTVCAGSGTTAVIITGPVAGTVYTWTNSNTTIGLGAGGVGNIPAFITINPTNNPVTATITVTPTYTNGLVSCTGPLSTFTITVNPQPNIIFSNMPPRVCLTDTLVNLADKVSPAGGTWAGNGVTGNTFSATAAGPGVKILSYTVTNTNGCTATAYFTVTVNDCTDRHNVFATAIRLYPNPSSGQFNIRFNSDIYTSFNVRVIDGSGRVYRSLTFSNLRYGSVIPMDLRELAGGTYFLQVYNESERAEFPFVIVR